jgi:hypothetical protein
MRGRANDGLNNGFNNEIMALILQAVGATHVLRTAAQNRALGLNRF